MVGNGESIFHLLLLDLDLATATDGDNGKNSDVGEWITAHIMLILLIRSNKQVV